jgi:hypothetical protein
MTGAAMPAYSLRWSLINFLPWLALNHNHDAPNLYFLGSLDFRHVPPWPASFRKILTLTLSLKVLNQTLSQVSHETAVWPVKSVHSASFLTKILRTDYG